MRKSSRPLIKTILLGLFALIALFNESCGQTKVENLDKLIGAYAENANFNGSVLVAEKGVIIYKKGFGLANMEYGIPNQPSTKFRLGSVTKQFTAMLIMQLVSENKLALDSPISRYLHDYPKKTGDRITIHHLLTHTSGIPDYTSFPGFRQLMGTTARPEELVRLFADSALEFAPGERYQYSNSGYVLLGFIIETITGKTYEQVLQSKILVPLEMNNTGYDHNSSVLTDRAAGYNRAGNSFQNANYIDMSVSFSAGGLYSTVEDLYKWDQALYTEKLLPKKYLDLSFAKQVPADGQFYGYGWMIGKISVGNSTDRIETIGHSGVINGFNARITRIPSDKSLIVLLNNTGGAPLDEMTVGIAGILNDKPYSFPKKSLAYSLLHVIDQDGLDAARLFYDKVKTSEDYQLNENDINSAGYELLQSSRAKEATFLFKINVEAFPNSFNAYDSYGEALLTLGDTTQSIENYKKSVKLNPGSQSGLSALKQLGVNTDTLVKHVPIEQLKILEGEYLVIDPPGGRNKYWKLQFKEEKGELFGNDGGYRYKLVPVAENKFINPDDGASFVFDASDRNSITVLVFGNVKFKKLS